MLENIYITRVRQYLLAVFLVGVATLLGWLAEYFFGLTAPFITYYPAALLVVFLTGTGPAFFAVVLSGMTAWFLFMEPAFSFGIEDIGDFIALFLFLASGIFLILIARRLTLARTQQAVYKTEKKYRNVFDNLQEIVAVYEVERDSAGLIVERRLRDANPAFLRSMGFSSVDEIRGKTSGEISGRVWSELHLPIVRKAMETGEIQMEEIHRPESNRDYLSSVVRLDAQTYLGTGWDITERKRTENELARTNRRISDILNSIEDTIYAVDRNWRFVYASNSFTSRFGKEPGDLIGKNIWEILPRHADTEYETNVRAAMDKRETRRFEMKGRRTGAYFSVAVFPSEEGITVLGVDITERKQMEEELRSSRDKLERHVQERTAELADAYESLQRTMDEHEKTEEQLRQAHKMEAMGTLAGGIAHDFNNMLGGIIGFTEMAIEDAEDRPDIQRNLKNVMKSANRSKELVKQILTFSRKTSYERTSVSLTPIIQETVKLLRASIPAMVEIKTSITTKSDTVLASSVEVQQILMNLCTNASLAMDQKGGILEISLSDTSDIDIVPFEGEKTYDEYVRLVVRDSGIGMTADVMKRIFDPFFTRREQGKGTGMGLAVVWGIVRSLNGTINVSSTPGEGSVFTVLLPKAGCATEQKPTEKQDIEGGTERVLYIEDEELLLEWGRSVFQRLGYKVTACADPQDALREFSLDPMSFDCIVTDYAMPSMSGAQLAVKLLEIRRDVPIILCTGHADNLSSKEAHEIGIREFLKKPLTKSELAAVVRKLLDSK
ncbi:MAG TPA: PAS domain-containing protein [Syntrophorhabdaceae bacterium]|nr:PAS domain-containing protein [Syntrophorhabdaceae bacterium]